MIRLICLAAITMFLAACATEPEIDNDTMLDGDMIFDPSLQDPSAYLVSKATDVATLAKDTPIVIAAHGFTASTFEWAEFHRYADSVGGILVSRVLLGGHGREYADFKASTWKDWGGSILDEYEALMALGFKNLSLAGSSTGGTLVLYHLSENAFSAQPPKEVFLVDPIIIPSSKLLTLVDLVGWTVGTDISKGTDAELAHWYSNRPVEALSELLDVVTLMRKRLEDRITLPPGTRLRAYKSTGDRTVQPISALMLYKGLRRADGSRVEVELVDSRLHVFTRLDGRSSWSSADSANQIETFEEMRSRLVLSGL